MIARLRGELVYKSIDHLIIDVGGVGYRLLVPLSTYYALPDSGPITLHTYTHVREDAMLLYGFQSIEEKDLFSILISISGIGPKLAINILSHIPTVELQEAIAEGDVHRLSSLPGIGKKTAERLVLELKDRVAKPIMIASQGSGGVRPLSTQDTLEDVLSALVNLGYKEQQARKALGNLEITPGNTMEQVLKSALKILVN